MRQKMFTASEDLYKVEKVLSANFKLIKITNISVIEILIIKQVFIALICELFWLE